MSASKVSKLKGRRSRKSLSVPDRRLQAICLGDESIHRINEAQSALKDVVRNCCKHLDVSLAVLILADKGITLRATNEKEPLDDSSKLVLALHSKLANCRLTTKGDSGESFEALTDVSELESIVPCRCIAAPVVVDQDRMEGALLFARSRESAAYDRREQELLAAIAANVAAIVKARFDTLTGLMKRSEFEHRVAKDMHASESVSGLHSVLHLNLDELQAVEDSLGRAARDEAIRQAGLLLAHMLADVGPVARIGEDDFGVFVADCAADRGWTIGEDIRRGISDLSIVWNDRPIKLTASIGVAQLSAESETIDSALAAASIACVVAKENGRDRVALYRHSDARLLHGRERMQSVESVHHALKNDDFLLYCQMIKPLTRSATVPHYEILLRGIDDQGEPLGPDKFLPHAERGRLMPAVDRWVIRHALEMLADYCSLLKRNKTFFAINLSAQSISDNSFLDFVIGELARTSVPMSALCFEVTESAAILNMDRAKKFMAVLRGKGCRFSLDDFGSGLSSFSYLKTLPIDFLKIDGQFVREIAEDPVSNAMVAAINQMSHAMGLKTIAEYVENRAIETQLAGLGVDYGQGFGIQRPQPLAEQLSSGPGARSIGAGPGRDVGS